jgi:hypothetical protein
MPTTVCTTAVQPMQISTLRGYWHSVGTPMFISRQHTSPQDDKNAHTCRMCSPVGHAGIGAVIPGILIFRPPYPLKIEGCYDAWLHLDNLAPCTSTTLHRQLGHNRNQNNYTGPLESTLAACRYDGPKALWFHTADGLRTTLLLSDIAAHTAYGSMMLLYGRHHSWMNEVLRHVTPYRAD